MKYPPGEARLRSKSLERCARVKIMSVGCPQTAGRASRSGVGLAFGHRLTNPARPTFRQPPRIALAGRAPRLLDVDDARPVDEELVVLGRLVARRFRRGDDRKPLLHVGELNLERLAGEGHVLKAGAHAAEFASKVDDVIEATDFEQIGKSMTNKAKKVGKAVGGFAKNRAGDAAQGANKVVNALGGMVETAEKLKLLKKVDFDKSMIGYKLTPGGMAVAAGGGLIASTIGGTKDYLGQRQGRNDGQTYSVTPSMVNPYTISQQMAYSQTGRSYADNAGADPGLAAAIMRR